MTQLKPIHVIGGGMAGSEAAWQIAQAEVPVILHEMRPETGTFAHQTGNFAELVCSNSFRSDDNEQNAVGLLHWEMRQASGIIMEMGDRYAVPAGGALAVDREPFAQAVTDKISNHPMITIDYGEVDGLPPEDWGSTIIATGPLTSPKLAENIREISGQDQLAFFDAIAPIVYAESIDMDKAWFQSRYDKGETEEERTAYLNCPMDKETYEAMIPGLEKAEFARLGGIHRNTFINSPILLDDQLRFKPRPNLRFAGQITGVEGYVESAAMGLLAGRLAAAEALGQDVPLVPNTTAIGALMTHITGGADAKTFQPMNVNFGLFPPLEGVKGGRRGRKERYKAYTDRAKQDWNNWLARRAVAA